MIKKDVGLIALAIVAAIMTFLMSMALSDASESERMAEEMTQLADAALDSLQVIHGHRLDLMKADSVRQLEYQDSVVAWSLERARLRTTLVTERNSHASLADSLRSNVDSASAAMVDRMEQAVVSMEAQRDSIERTKDAQIALLYQSVQAKDEIIDLQIDELAQWQRRDLARDAVEDALRGQVRALKRRSWVGYGAATVAIGLALVR